MEAKAQAKMVRISSRKVKLVIDLIRGKGLGESLSILRLTPRAASPVVEKLVRSAAANADHNYNMELDKLYIKEIYVGEGPTLKRFRPRAQGRATQILKRTSHITVVVAEKE
jgi:large subunit ribosomal protein L22